MADAPKRPWLKWTLIGCGGLTAIGALLAVVGVIAALLLGGTALGGAAVAIGAWFAREESIQSKMEQIEAQIDADRMEQERMAAQLVEVDSLDDIVAAEARAEGEAQAAEAAALEQAEQGAVGEAAPEIEEAPAPGPQATAEKVGAAAAREPDLEERGSPPPVPQKASSSGVPVSLRGKATVTLIGEAGRFPVPGSVPPGSYEIEAIFAGEAPLTVGRARAVEGGELTISCNDRMGNCRAVTTE